MRPVSTLPAAICVHDDVLFLPAVLKSLEGRAEATVFVSRAPWSGEPGDWEHSVRVAEAGGAHVVVGDWDGEHVHRQAAIDHMRAEGAQHLLIPDSDEVFEPQLLDSLLAIAKADLAEQVLVRPETYWKDAHHAVRPREPFCPLVMVHAQLCDHVAVREYSGGRRLLLPESYGLLHHLSYAGPDARILRKITVWGHKDEVVPGWWEEKWLGWDADPTLRDLHPTHPGNYAFVQRVTPVAPLADVDCGREVRSVPDVPADWPKVSVVVPLYGGAEDLRQCLDSLADCGELVHEVVVVDDVSPDDAATVTEGRAGVTLVSHDVNQGFAAACNTGLARSSGDVVVFLNSDTVVPKAGLVRLIESLMASNSIGAAGPCSDNVGYFQHVPAVFEGRDGLEGFATDFAWRKAEDRDVSMLVGFCLAMRRETAVELGGFSLEYGRGLFEDNDLCYRLQRAGHRLVLSSRAFVHHKGSQSLGRMTESAGELLQENEQKYLARWRHEVECGFASHLAGHRPDPVRFDPQRHPDRLDEQLAELAKKADVSLCMIVRDEERVIKVCLDSTKGMFTQRIVVDTGSVDRTKEIVKASGAELYESSWQMSFSTARNESLKPARGKWIFWMDADDTLPKECALRILDAAAHAPDDIVAFIVPVQFLEGGRPVGTRVDHVKLIRNFPGIEFEGRIHEQVLPSIRRHGGQIARLDAYVLHSGYDTSEQGQAKKRRRDDSLLKLDLEERPGHPFVLFNLGMTAHFNGDAEDAVAWLRQCLEVSGPHESHVRKAYSLLGSSLLNLDRHREAADAFRQGLEAVGGDPELRFNLARTLSHAGRASEARLEYEKVLHEPRGEFSSFDTGILGDKLFFNLGQVCLDAGDGVAACMYFEKALECSPHMLTAAVALFDAAMDREDFKRAGVAMRALDRSPDFEVWADRFAELAKARGDDPASAFMRLAEREPGRSRGRLGAGRALMQEGRHHEGAPVLIELVREGEPRAAFYLGVACLNAGDKEGAKQWFHDSFIIDPHNPNTLALLESLSR